MNGEAGKGSKRRQEDVKKVREGLDRIDWSDGMEREVALDGVLNMAKGFRVAEGGAKSKENTRMTYEEFSEGIRVDFGGDGA